jgi:mycothiol synthase
VSTDPAGIAVRTHLDPATIDEVASLIQRVTDHDGMRPVSEHVWLHLKEGGDPRGQHLVARDSSGQVVGYAHLDITDPVDGPSAEVAVDPQQRRMGLGRSLVEALIGLSPDGRLRLWAHGEQAGATELATGMGFTHARVLWQMRRSLYAPLPRPAFPPGIDVRPFAVGHDEQPWLDLNAKAFVSLPDQGGWTRDDLDRRIREPWFSADGFLMAWDGSELAGFHWTKVHGRLGSDREHHHNPIGEVYVVGVDPARRGSGLGRGLTLAGLHHLRALDLSQAMLYVDDTNTAAIALYEGLGFSRWDTDVLFRRGPSTAGLTPPG